MYKGNGDSGLQKKNIKQLQQENRGLKSKLAEADAVVTCVRKIFTDGQIRKMISPGNVQWNWKDISNAICIHASGPRAYNHLYKKGFLHTATLGWQSQHKRRISDYISRFHETEYGTHSRRQSLCTCV